MTHAASMTKARGAIAAAFACVAVLMIASGCSTQPKMSKEDQENFNGGPMPPGFLEKQGGGAAPGPVAAPAAPAAAGGAKGSP